MNAALEAGPVLVVNAGSSSLKVSLMSGDGSCLRHTQWPWDPSAPEADITAFLQRWIPEWIHPPGEGDGLSPRLIAHRVVHGADRFLGPTLLGDSELAILEELVSLAPLHNGPALRVMRWLKQVAPELPQWACFDTAFHHSLPPEASTYAIPSAWRHLGLRRYGFHGLNHQHVSEVVHMGHGESVREDQPLRLISCHLGAGCSLCAIKGGRSIATTMGFTPMEGLVMATRSGSIDPGLILHLLRQGLDVEELEHGLNEESGLLGLSCISGSMKDLRSAAASGQQGAVLAIASFTQRLLEGIGAMAASLGGVDVIALTGGIGEHDTVLMQDLREALTWLEPFELRRVPADEERLIARLCLHELAGRKQATLN